MIMFCVFCAGIMSAQISQIFHVRFILPVPHSPNVVLNDLNSLSPGWFDRVTGNTPGVTSISSKCDPIYLLLIIMNIMHGLDLALEAMNIR